MSELVISLLGPLRVWLASEPVTGFCSDKARALLAYLAVEEGISHRREELAGLLWPGYPERSARQSLSQALFSLRSALRLSADDAPPVATGHPTRAAVGALSPGVYRRQRLWRAAAGLLATSP